MESAVKRPSGATLARITLIGFASALPCALPLAAAAQSCTSGSPKPLVETWAPARMKSSHASITIFTGPVDHGAQLQLASGLDKSLWVTMVTIGSIMKFSTKGKVEIYATPMANSAPEAITQNGNAMYFTEWATSCTGSITKSGKIQEYPTPLGQTQATGMVVGADGNSWFVTDFSGIGQLKKNGRDKQFYFTDDNTQPTAITEGPDGNIWFIENQGSNVGKITTKGVVTEYNVNTGGAYSFGITSGSDGRIWFADAHNSRIGAIKTDGTGLTYYSTGLTGTPISIVSGPDGNLYFGETTAVVGKITTAGVISEYPFTASEGSFPILSIVTGPDKNIWFSNNSHSQVGMLKLPTK